MSPLDFIVSYMRSSELSRLAELAAGQHGVFTRADARHLGVPDSTLTSAVAAGRFKSASPGVFIVTGCPPTVQQRMMVAVLSMTSLTAVSHAAAAEMWRLTDRGLGNIEVVTTRWDRLERSDVTVHESRDLIDADITELDGIPITSPVRTVVDLGATKPWAVEQALETGVRRELFTLADVERFVTRVGRRGRRGVGVIRPLLEDRRRWDTATESALEDRFRKVVADFGLPLPLPQFVLRDEYQVFVCRADFAYPRQKLLIELDSEAHHMDRITFRRDRSKQNRAVALGWTVLRFTWWDVQNDPYQVGAHLKAVLAAHPAV